jgi:hypothetical protein
VHRLHGGRRKADRRPNEDVPSGVACREGEDTKFDLPGSSSAATTAKITMPSTRGFASVAPASTHQYLGG